MMQLPPTQHAAFPYDVERVRADFPILMRQHSANTPLTYLDNAASSQKPLAVINAIDHYYRHMNANVHRGIHLLSEEATAAFEGARVKLKRFINASNKREVIFTRGTTESINLVAQTWGRSKLKHGDVIILTEMEHHANIVPWQMLAAEKGCTIRYVPMLTDYTLDLDAFAQLLKTQPVKLVAATYVSNVLGTVNPIPEMVRMTHEAGAIILVDGAQAVPHFPVDVQALNVDFFAFSSHKMIGPTGIGVLYGKRALLEAMPPWMGGGDMISSVTFEGSTWNDLPYKFEAGTPSIAEGIGLGAAIDYLNSIGMANIHKHERAMTEYVMQRLATVSRIRLYGPSVEKKGAVAAFTLDGIHAHDLAQLLDTQGVAVRAGHHCAMPLHSKLNIAASVRASFYLYNTYEDVERLVAALENAKRVFAA
jgi:cysteine desulfurase / selenocysteine lyase